MQRRQWALVAAVVVAVLTTAGYSRTMSADRVLLEHVAGGPLPGAPRLQDPQAVATTIATIAAAKGGAGAMVYAGYLAADNILVALLLACFALVAWLERASGLSRKWWLTTALLGAGYAVSDWSENAAVIATLGGTLLEPAWIVAATSCKWLLLPAATVAALAGLGRALVSARSR